MNKPEQKIGQYAIVEKLGSGGFGIVYRATYTVLDQTVALKILKPVLMANPDFVARFKQEAKLAAKLQHSHLVRIMNFVEDADRLGIVSEFLSGGDLKQRMSKQALSLHGIARILTHIGSALDYMHAQEMIHRDVKPSNILFNAEGQAVLTDFGVAKALRGAQVEMGSDSAEAYYVTTTGGTVGTPAYMAPEQIMGEAMDGRVDVYALGIVAYEMLTGTVPFNGPPTKVHHGHVYETPPALIEKSPALPPMLSDVVLKALAKKPEERYAMAGAFTQAFTDAVEQVEGEWLPGQLKEIDREVKGEEALNGAVARLEVWAQLFPYREDIAKQLKQLRARKRFEDLYDDVRQRWDQARSRAEELVALVPDAPDPDRILARLLDKPAEPADEPSDTPTDRKLPIWVSGVLAIIALVLGLGLGTQIDLSVLLPKPTPELGATRVREADGMTQVYVPAGEFEMGHENGSTDERPVHTVALDAFWLDRTEVTNVQYQGCVIEGVCELSEQVDNKNYSGAAQPVVGVDWNDAVTYCEWIGGRLPTEAEWEYAARGPENMSYPWGNTWQTGWVNCRAGQCQDGYAYTAPVGNFSEAASWVGALDMSGNVWEWVVDWYDPDYYSRSPYDNPVGPEDGTQRVLPGGSWRTSKDTALCYYRYKRIPDLKSVSGGFRCVQSISSAP